MSKSGSIWQLFVLCLLALRDTVPKCYLLTIVGDTPGKEKVAKWSSAPASILEGFNEIEGQKTFQNWYKKHNCAKSTRVYPPMGGVLCVIRACQASQPEGLTFGRFSSGEVRGASREVWGTSEEPVDGSYKSTVREVPGKLRGTSREGRNSWKF